MIRIAASGQVREREEWRPVVGLEGSYEVSSTGRVRSVDRIITQETRWGRRCERRMRGHVLRPHREKSGYLGVQLGRHRKERVHELVAAAFIGPRPAGHHTRHGPRGTRVNTPQNLSYGTAAQNSQDRVDHGGTRGGEGHPTAILKHREVACIRAFYLMARASDLAAIFSVQTKTIQVLWRGGWAAANPMDPAQAADFLRRLILRTGAPYPRVYVALRRRRKDALPNVAMLPSDTARRQLHRLCRDPGWLP